MSIMLTSLADWCRDAGVRVKEYPGWQTRVRGGGPYSSMPLCVMWHHTASPPTWDGQRDADYIAKGDTDAPLSNLYIDRSGLVWVIAAGPTNTNGKGGPMTLSRGTVPQDGMNSRAIGIEMGNNGVGETWPQVQVDACFAVSNYCNQKCGNRPEDISSHYWWTPGRKIDPATSNGVQGPWRPRSQNSSGTWHIDDMRNECIARAGGGNKPKPPTPQPPDEDDMLFDGFWKRDNADYVYAIWRNGTKQWMTDPGYLDAMQRLQAMNGATSTQTSIRTETDPAMFAAFGLVIGPLPGGVDQWGNPV